MADALTQVLADARSEARALERHAPSQPIAAALLELCDKVDAASCDLTRFVNESDAQLHSGKRRAWLRAQYAGLAAQGDAYTEHGVRYYRLKCLPHRPDLAAAREEAEQVVAGMQRAS